MQNVFFLNYVKKKKVVLKLTEFFPYYFNFLFVFLQFSLSALFPNFSLFIEIIV